MNLLIYGINGYMGRIIESLALEDEYFDNVHGISSSFSNMDEDLNYDILIDFSHSSAFDNVLNLAREKKIPLVSGTTGIGEEQKEKMELISKEIPILYGTNMSLGMNLMFELVEQTAKSLGNSVDIEVLEAHHNRKKDAPSGSATTIVDSIEKGLGETRKHQNGRLGQCPREKGEIGIHAIRGGNIVGQHEALFINELETIKISHEAYDRKVFAKGAIEASKFLVGKKPKLYSMKDVLKF